MTEPDALDMLLDAMVGDLFVNLAALDFSFIVPRSKPRAGSWKQRDVTRALRAAAAAGIEVRIEIEPDGKLILVPVTVMTVTDDPQSDDDILARLA
jgi:hypothetical protein